jgi:ferritin-like metal-binding protein YciE
MLKDIYYAERKILKALPKMIKAVGRESKLGEAFEKHFEETEGQIERLEEVFESIGQKAKGETCQAIEGITEEAQDLMHEVDCKATLEAGLLAGAQAVEHYEIARYGTLVEWAKRLGHAHAVKLLEQTLLNTRTIVRQPKSRKGRELAPVPFFMGIRYLNAFYYGSLKNF